MNYDVVVVRVLNCAVALELLCFQVTFELNVMTKSGEPFAAYWYIVIPDATKDTFPRSNLCSCVLAESSWHWGKKIGNTSTIKQNHCTMFTNPISNAPKLSGGAPSPLGLVLVGSSYKQLYCWERR